MSFFNQTLVSCNDNSTNPLIFDEWNFFTQLTLLGIHSIFCIISLLIWIFTRNEKVMKSRGLYTPFYIFMVFLNALYYLILTFINKERFYCFLYPLLSFKFVTISLFIYFLQSLKYFTVLRVQNLYSKPNYEQNLTFSAKILIYLNKILSFRLTIPLMTLTYFFIYYFGMYIIVLINWRLICDVRDPSSGIAFLMYDWIQFFLLVVSRIFVVLFDSYYFLKEKKFSFKEFFIYDDPFYFRSNTILLLVVISFFHFTTRLLSVLPLDWYCSNLELVAPLISTSSHLFFLMIIVWVPGIISIIKRVKRKRYEEEKFQMVCKDQDYKEKFIQFLKNDCTLQYFLLFEEIQRFKTSQKKKQQAFIIFKNYIEENGSLKVEIPSDIQSDLKAKFHDILEKKIKDVPEDIFNEVESKILEIIKESYISFIGTYDYTEIMNEKSQLLKSLL